MSVDIKNFVRSCHTCQVGLPYLKRTQQHGLLRSLQSSSPWDVLVMDFLGPFLPVTSQGNKYILVFIDVFTRWIELIPAPTASGGTVSHALFEIFARFGCPRTLLSDRGSHFRNEVIGNISTRCGVQQLFSLPYHHEAVGIVERVMSPIKKSLRSITRERSLDWDLFMPGIAMGLRFSPHSTTFNTPFFLTYGRDPRWPADVVFPSDTKIVVNDTTSIDGFLCNLQRVLNTTYEISQGLVNWRAATSTLSTGRKDVSFPVHSLVYLYRPEQRNMSGIGKLQGRWVGPFRVLQKSDVVGGYKLRHLYTERVREAHVSHMRSFQSLALFADSQDFHDTSLFSSTNYRDNEVLARAEELFDVEGLVDHASIGTRKKRQWTFLVKWLGYDDNENSWVTYDNLVLSCQELVDKYLSVNKLPTRPYGRIKNLPRIPVFVPSDDRE